MELATASLLLTGASAGFSIISGLQESQELKFQAKQADQQSRLENIKAKETANQIRTQLNADLASANATFSSRGILPGSGSALNAQIQSKANASRDIETALFGGRTNAAQLKSQAEQYKSSAKSSVIKGFGQAAVTAGTGLKSYLDFGTTPKRIS